MDTVTILRELWRQRILVAVAAGVAVLVGLALSYHLSFPPESRKYEVGIASARILVDTPDSQVIDVAPKGSETLSARASLLASLMTQGEVKEQIAGHAGLNPSRLLARSESAVETPLGPVATETTPPSAWEDPDARLYTTRLVSNQRGEPLPIIDIEAQAPDAAQAAKLADAAIAGLGDYLDSKAAVEQVSFARRLQVTGLGAPQVAEVVRGPRRGIALVAAALVFVGGCALILMAPALARRWPAASEREEFDSGLGGEAAKLWTPDAAGEVTPVPRTVDGAPGAERERDPGANGDPAAASPNGNGDDPVRPAGAGSRSRLVS